MSNKQLKITLLQVCRSYLHISGNAIETALRQAAFKLDIHGYDAEKVNAARRELTNYVHLATAPHTCLRYWLRHHGHAPEHFHVAEHRKLQDTRKAWIDWMIQCLEEDLAKEQK